jgi:hypothetical protein
MLLASPSNLTAVGCWRRKEARRRKKRKKLMTYEMR